MAGKPKITEETKAKMLTLYRQGLYDPQIAKAVGISRNSVYLWRYGLGLKANATFKKEPKQQLKEACGVHWSKALTPDQWELVKRFFKAVLDRKTFGRFEDVSNRPA